jgi:DNA-binding MarR family transcriptional regulator
MPRATPSTTARPRSKTPATRRAPKPVAHYSGETYSVDDSYGYLVRRLHASLQRHIERRVQSLDLTALQWGPLLLVAQGKGDTAAALARALDIDTGAVTRMLDRLERKGLIKRRRSTNDRRLVHLELTDEGRHAIGLVPFAIAEVLNLHLAGFSEREVRQLKRFLSRMIDNGNPPALTEPV